MEEIAKFASSFQQEQLIAIQLNPADETYFVPQALLLQASEYFEKALKGFFVETEQRKLRLPGCDTPTLHLFLFWLGNKELPNLCDSLVEVFRENEGMITATKRPESELQINLIKLWSFGEAYLIPKLQNAAMACLLDVLQASHLSTDAVRVAYELSVSQMFRAMIAKEVAQSWKTGRYSQQEVSSMSEIEGFLQAVFQSMGVCSQIRCKHEMDCPCSRSNTKGRKQYMVCEQVS